ncbi:SGNH/GDSL hydrolase family protein [Zavarzinella formosa]|uniref:SGNH/GDSL hydrolase family protein n=1 Tax=Zavarzinella formosa TaxID=360055 RepID=UPI0002E6E980|nr:SGNH/GDSL hydrolase family protein [Zavarzinella formosa]
MRHVRPDIRRSRRVLSWALAGFFLIQFAGGLVLDYARPGIRFPMMRSMLDSLAMEPRSPDVIVLGSSRFQACVNATELTHEVRAATGKSDFRAFHAAVGGSDAIAMELALNNILDAGYRPGLVIVEMTPTTITRNTPWYNWHVARQIRWDNTPTHLGELTVSGQLGRFIQARLVPLYRHRYEIRKSIRASTGVFPPPQESQVSSADLPRPLLSEADWNKELSPRPLTPGEAELARKGVDIGWRELRAFGPNSNALDALDRMLTRCRELNIPVVLVGAPLSSVFREKTQPINETYHEILKRIQEKHGVEFVDAHAVIPDHLFVDFHHTTPEGSIVFSRWLARRLLVPRWSEHVD